MAANCKLKLTVVKPKYDETANEAKVGGRTGSISSLPSRTMDIDEIVLAKLVRVIGSLHKDNAQGLGI